MNRKNAPSSPTRKVAGSQIRKNGLRLAKPKAISAVQKLQFELIQRASFNAFDGPRVIADLKKHRDFWEGVIMDCPGEMISLIKLRDISSNYWNVDTLYILAALGKERKLKALAKTWNADELSWIKGKQAGDLLGEWPVKKKILAVWWD